MYRNGKLKLVEFWPKAAIKQNEPSRAEPRLREATGRCTDCNKNHFESRIGVVLITDIKADLFHQAA